MCKIDSDFFFSYFFHLICSKICSAPSQSAICFLVFTLPGFPGGADSKESAWDVGDLGLILGWEDPLEEGVATHSSILAWRIPMDRGAWQATVHRVTKSNLAGKEPTCNARYRGLIPGWGRSSGEGIGYPLQHSWASLVAQLVKNLPALWETWVRSWVGKIPWRREWLPTPVFLSGEFHGLYSQWGRKESDTTEWLSLSLFTFWWFSR